MIYELTASEIIVRVSDRAHIPRDAENQDYKDYLRWLDSGNVPLPIAARTPLNVVRITRSQGKKHLIAKGCYGVIKSAIDSEQSSDAMRIGFYDEENWLINDEFVLAAATLIGWNPEQLQHEFNEAAKL